MADGNIIKWIKWAFKKAKRLEQCYHWIHHLHHCTFYTARLNSCTQTGWLFSSRFQVIQYTSSRFYNYTFNFTIRRLKPSLSVRLSPSVPSQSGGILQSFQRNTLFQQSLWIEKRIRGNECSPFSKCPMEKNKKALQYHSIFIHWGRQWTCDGLKPKTPTPPGLNANTYSTTCRHATRASSTTWGLTTQRPFFCSNEGEQRNVAKKKLNFLLSKRRCGTVPLDSQQQGKHSVRLRGQSWKSFLTNINFIKWKLLLLSKTILINVQLRRA